MEFFKRLFPERALVKEYSSKFREIVQHSDLLYAQRIIAKLEKNQKLYKQLSKEIESLQKHRDLLSAQRDRDEALGKCKY